MILSSCLFPIKSDCFVFVLTVGAPNQAIKNSLSLNHYLTLINQNTWQKTWLSTKPVQDKPALLFSLEKAADALTLSLSSMLALWKPQFRKVRLWRVSQSPACSQFRFSEQLPSKGLQIQQPLAPTHSFSFLPTPWRKIWQRYRNVVPALSHRPTVAKQSTGRGKTVKKVLGVSTSQIFPAWDCGVGCPSGNRT